ncbi:hypothetical protein HYT84_03140 [Candidatus Micrarchaeota archaeon]|nr:hypothetical protein [Candidatus Micrarchaeota archaeon]
MVNILRKALIAGGLVAMLGCGDDSENCEVRETEGCEDFTGLYKIDNFKEFLACNTLPDWQGDLDTWLCNGLTSSDDNSNNPEACAGYSSCADCEGYVSIESSADCRMELTIHGPGPFYFSEEPQPSTLNNWHDQILDCSPDDNIKGNRYFGHSPASDDYVEAIKCNENNIRISIDAGEHSNGTCEAKLSRISGDIFEIFSCR